MQHEFKRLQEYIKNKKPFYTYHQFSMYEYNNDSDLVYDREDNDFFFVDSNERDKTKSPINRSFHRLDGPAHITSVTIYWYIDNTFYTFRNWINKTTISSQEKVKLRLKYAHSQ